jgi:hypothetical protein
MHKLRTSFALHAQNYHNRTRFKGYHAKITSVWSHSVVLHDLDSYCNAMSYLLVVLDVGEHCTTEFTVVAPLPNFGSHDINAFDAPRFSVCVI